MKLETVLAKVDANCRNAFGYLWDWWEIRDWLRSHLPKADLAEVLDASIPSYNPEYDCRRRMTVGMAMK